MIPKIIHQLWIGDKPRPAGPMDLWKEMNTDFDQTKTVTLDDGSTVQVNVPAEEVSPSADTKFMLGMIDYEQLKKDYSTPENQTKLYEILKDKNLIGKASKGEFLDMFFPIPSEIDSTEINKEEKTEIETAVVETSDETKTEQINWESPELKGKWSYEPEDEIGQGIWRREIEEENPNFDPNQPEGEENSKTITTKAIVPTNSVPKEVLQQWEKESKVKTEIEGGQA